MKSHTLTYIHTYISIILMYLYPFFFTPQKCGVHADEEPKGKIKGESDVSAVRESGQGNEPCHSQKLLWCK